MSSFRVPEGLKCCAEFGIEGTENAQPAIIALILKSQQSASLVYRNFHSDMDMDFEPGEFSTLRRTRNPQARPASCKGT